MKESTGDASSGATPRSPSAVESDYRIREMEARLDRRVAAIESQRGGRKWTTRLASAGFVVALGALALVLWAGVSDDGTSTVQSLSTQELLLRDGEGIARGRLATDSDGRAELTLSDRDGRERIRLTVLADGSPGLTISDPDARPRVVLGYLPDGTTNLVLADARGTSRAVFGLEPDGSTQALFADHAGNIRTVVGVGADGAPSVSIVEAETEEESSPTP